MAQRFQAGAALIRNGCVHGLAITCAGAVFTWLCIGTGFANYDTAYALLWGSDIASGRIPDYGVAIAPTPHPLATAVSVLLSPLGPVSAEASWVFIAFLSLGLLGWLTYDLGARWFGRAAGALAAAIILTRIPVLSFGVRAYIDIPYIAFALLAVRAQVCRQGPLIVLAWLALAGLLRPEAWLFSFGFVAYTIWRGERRRSLLFALGAIAAAAPLLWALSDLIITGNPLHSFTATHANAGILERKTGLLNLVLLSPRRVGEILREPVLYGCTVGVVLALLYLPGRSRPPAAVSVVAFLAFSVLALSGLPILGRYLLLLSTLLAIFCGAGAFGWTQLEQGKKSRRRWQWVGASVLLGLMLFVPRQVQRIDSLRSAMIAQREIRDDLYSLTATQSFHSKCEPISVPNHRPVPLLALWTRRLPSEIISAQQGEPTRGLFIAPASASVERNFMLDPHDPKRLTVATPAGFKRVAQNRSWLLYERCGKRSSTT